jgi:hypothetical protein
MKGRFENLLVRTTLNFPYHPSEAVLENYALHRLREGETASFEEHLLLCESCQDALEELDQFILLIKATASDPVPKVAFRAHPPRTTIQNLIWGGGAVAAALAILVLAWQPPEPSALASVTLAPVTLSSFRGTQDVGMAHAPSQRNLVLSIDARDLTPTETYRIEIVNATGKPAWKGPTASSGGKLAAVVPATLNAGLYWVRLYGRNAELLREFGLKLD